MNYRIHQTNDGRYFIEQLIWTPIEEHVSLDIARKRLAELEPSQMDEIFCLSIRPKELIWQG